MRIGLDTHYIGKPGIGNSTYMRGLLSGLLKAAPENHYVFFDSDWHPFYDLLLQNYGPDSFSFKRVFSPHGIIRNFISLPRAINRSNLDIFHAQVILPPRLTCATVMTIHDLCFERYPGVLSKFETIFLPIIMRWSALRCDQIIAVSDFTKQNIVNSYKLPPSKIVTIMEACEERFAPIDEAEHLIEIYQKYGIYKDFVLFTGRHDEHRKNVDVLIDAFARLTINLKTKYQLIITGRVKKRTKYLMQRAQVVGIGSRVKFVGLVSDQDLPMLISGAHVLVYTSSCEGFGLPVLEAMSCGTPVIASNVSAIPEVAGEAAILISPRDTEALTRNLARILNDSNLRHTLKRAGLEQAKFFSWEEVGRKTAQVYKQILKIRG